VPNEKTQVVGVFQAYQFKFTQNIQMDEHGFKWVGWRMMQVTGSLPWKIV
jgi:hypothetical protein